MSDAFLFYDKDGEPLDALQWAHLFEDDAYRRVGDDTVEDGVRISTVWLGAYTNHSGPPQIFETGRLNADGTFDAVLARYAFLAEAEEGHKGWVLRERARLGAQQWDGAGT